MRPEFLHNGKFSHSAVVSEVLDRKLSGDDIRRLADDPEMQAEFYGDFTSYKRPKKEWGEDYLKQLTYVACEECFSIDLLLYLDEVVSYLTWIALLKKILYVLAGALLIIAGYAVWKYAGRA